MQPATLAIGAIAASAVAITIFAPDMVTGSEHDHIPLAGILGVLWAAAAVAHVVAVDRDPTARRALVPFVPWIAAAWALAAVVAVFGPELVTGTDPTHVPVTAFSTPLMAAFATTYMCVRAALLAQRDRA